jgi:hypothetical protein
MDQKRLAQICERGEKADQLLTEGRTRDALKAFTEIVKDLEKKGDYDSYLAAKVTLSLLRCHIKLGDFKRAYAVWNANLEESLQGIGIYSLESAQTTVPDMITYDMLCAFLHTLGDSEKAANASAVNQYLSRVCEHALEHGDRSIMRTALSNWKQHLRDIFGATVPGEYAKPLIKFEKLLGDVVRPQAIDFPKTSAWEKPRDFLEMSRLSNDKSSKPARIKKRSAS